MLVLQYIMKRQGEADKHGHVLETVEAKDQRPGISNCLEQLLIIQTALECVIYTRKGTSILKTQDLTFTCFTRD